MFIKHLLSCGFNKKASINKTHSPSRRTFYQYSLFIKKFQMTILLLKVVNCENKYSMYQKLFVK